MNDDPPLRRAHLVALRFLSYRPRTETEVKSRLRSRFPAPIVEQVLELLKDEALVDDVRFASEWRAGRESHNPRSGWAIKRELVAKGVDGLVAEEAVRDVDDEDKLGQPMVNFRLRPWHSYSHRANHSRV